MQNEVTKFFLKLRSAMLQLLSIPRVLSIKHDFFGFDFDLDSAGLR